MALRWFQLAGQFPAKLNTEQAVDALKPNETPEAYGLTCGQIGAISKGSIPGGTARTVKTYTVAKAGYTSPTATYVWMHNRLMRSSGTTIYYGAPDYTNYYYEHGIGQLEFPEQSGAILTMLPIGDGSMLVCTAGGSYMVANIANNGANLVKSGIMQEVVVADATYATEFNGVAYVSGAQGLYALDGQSAQELTFAARTRWVAAIGGCALTINYLRGFIVGASKFAYDIGTKTLYDYATSGFRFTSRAMREKDGRPFRVQSVAFLVQHATASTDKYLDWECRWDGGTWVECDRVKCDYEDGLLTRVEAGVPESRMARQFQVRLTAASASLNIKEIQVYAEMATMDSYEG